MLNQLQRAAIRHLVAHEFSPPDTRLQHKQWCDVMGISVRTLERWRSLDEFKRAHEKARKDAEETCDPFALYARQFALEQLVSLLSDKKLTAAEKRATIKDIMAQTAHVADASDAVDYSEMSDEDLEAVALNRDVSVLAMTSEQIRGMV